MYGFEVPVVGIVVRKLECDEGIFFLPVLIDLEFEGGVGGIIWVLKVYINFSVRIIERHVSELSDLHDS
jgi:hypothetical protein